MKRSTKTTTGRIGLFVCRRAVPRKKRRALKLKRNLRGAVFWPARFGCFLNLGIQQITMPNADANFPCLTSTSGISNQHSKRHFF